MLNWDKQIIKNYESTEIKDPYDTVIKLSNEEYKNGINDNLIDTNDCKACATGAIKFKHIDGAYCKKCGYVYPF